jgi:hypothetical protein
MGAMRAERRREAELGPEVILGSIHLEQASRAIRRPMDCVADRQTIPAVDLLLASVARSTVSVAMVRTTVELAVSLALVSAGALTTQPLFPRRLLSLQSPLLRLRSAVLKTTRRRLLTWMAFNIDYAARKILPAELIELSRSQAPSTTVSHCALETSTVLPLRIKVGARALGPAHAISRTGKQDSRKGLNKQTRSVLFELHLSKANPVCPSTPLQQVRLVQTILTHTLARVRARTQGLAHISFRTRPCQQPPHQQVLHQSRPMATAARKAMAAVPKGILVAALFLDLAVA